MTDTTAISEGSLAESKEFDGKVFPLTLLPAMAGDPASKESITTWLSGHRERVDELLLEHKGILFRGFQLSTANDFHQFVDALGYKDMEYTGGAAVRTQITPRVFTANESPASESIPFHHELAQTPHPPTHVFFFCERPPTTGGATPILVSSEVYHRMNSKHPDFMRALEDHGVRYIRVMPCENDPTSAIGRGWKATFNCESAQEAEEKMRKLGSEWEWLQDESGDEALRGCLRTFTAVVPGIRTDTRTNQKTFFNSVVAAYTGWNDCRNVGSKAVMLGDGSHVGEQEMLDAQDIMAEIQVAFPWQQGDVLLLDNRTVMHSRQPFTGPRRILASLNRDSTR